MSRDTFRAVRALSRDGDAFVQYISHTGLKKWLALNI